MKIIKGCTPGQLVRCGITSSGHQSAVFYLWSTKGRAAYRAQWRFLQSSADGIATMRAGWDAIRRSANASWFEWLKGSAPFFLELGGGLSEAHTQWTAALHHGPIPAILETTEGASGPSEAGAYEGEGGTGPKTRVHSAGQDNRGDTVLLC